MSELWESQGGNSVLVVVWEDTNFSAFGVFCSLHGLLEEVKAGLREDFLPDNVSPWKSTLSRSLWPRVPVLTDKRGPRAGCWPPSPPAPAPAGPQAVGADSASLSRPPVPLAATCSCGSLHQEEVTKKSLFTSQTLNTLHLELSTREGVEQQPCRFKAVPGAQAACFLAQVSPAQAPVTAPRSGRPGEGRFS